MSATKPAHSTNRPLLFAAAGGIFLAAGLAAASWLTGRAPQIPAAPQLSGRTATASLCPWREPEADLHAFFPCATRYDTETRILSGQRLQMARALGRPVAAEESALHLFRVHGPAGDLGTVMVRRVKGRYGAIEVVTAVNPDGRVHGVRLQSLREPDPVSRELRSPAWLHRFDRKGPDADWRLGSGLPSVSPEARPSAEAIAEGVRSLVVVYEIAQRNGLKAPEEHHPE